MENPEKVVADHKIFGCKHIGLGVLPGGSDNTIETVNEFLKKAKPVTRRIADAGGYFMYHNHNFEFKDMGGEILMDKFAEYFDTDEFGFTLDVHWVKAAGHDPVDWLNKLKGRTPCVHFKDLLTMPNGKFRYAPVGYGEL